MLHQLTDFYVRRASCLFTGMENINIFYDEHTLAKGTVRPRDTGTVPLVRLSRNTLERQVHIGKKT